MCAAPKQSKARSVQHFQLLGNLFIPSRLLCLPYHSPLPRSPLHICLSGRLSDICLFIYLSCRHNTRNSLLRCCCGCFRQQWQPKVLQPAVKSSAFLIEAHTHTHTCEEHHQHRQLAAYCIFNASSLYLRPLCVHWQPPPSLPPAALSSARNQLKYLEEIYHLRNVPRRVDTKKVSLALNLLHAAFECINYGTNFVATATESCTM